MTNSHHIVDHMMRTLRNYAADLEKVINDRTLALDAARRRADHLLEQMFPPSVSHQLRMGQTVAPQLHTCTTVAFVNLLDFTHLCGEGSALQIVGTLNALFSQIDALVAAQSGYKVSAVNDLRLISQVDTIGDRYVVATGLGNSEQPRADQMATIALGILQLVDAASVPFMPGEYKLRCRIGVNSGPVASGLIGLHAPRYCLFGETVREKLFATF